MGKEAAEEHKPFDPQAEEKKRLRALAVSRRLLSRAPANPSRPLEPSKSIVKLDGRDIVKRGQRRSRYLFCFPGLLAPISGGRIGELADLATKNPTLYLEFPQGRMKLFGTHVYPKNKYLTLQLTKSSKGVMCEDCFESMIVFSDAWWIGLKEENPEECQLEFPKEFNMGKQTDFDFKGGAGASPEEKSGASRPGKEHKEPLSLKTESEDDLPDDSDTPTRKDKKNVTEATPVRQSARTAGKSLNYAESSSGDDSVTNDAEVTEMIDVKIQDSKPASTSMLDSVSMSTDTKIKLTGKMEQSALSSKKSDNPCKMGALVQASLSTLFEKAADKKPKRKADVSPAPKGSKKLRLDIKKMAEPMLVKESKKKMPISRKTRTGTRRGTSLKQFQVEDDEIEDISSESEDLIDSDEDWAA